jgi:hypothetical protein
MGYIGYYLYHLIEKKICLKICYLSKERIVLERSSERKIKLKEVQ